MNTRQSLISILACILLLAGCARTSGIQARSISLTGPNGETTYSSYVNVDNSTLSRHLAVVRFDRSDIAGLVKVALTLQSLTERTQALQYRWTWFDAKGFEVESASQAWQPLIIYGMQMTAVQGLAPNPSVRDLKLHIRYQD